MLKKRVQHNDERGVALLAVLVTILVATLLVGALLAVAVNSLATSADMRASQQALDAATSDLSAVLGQMQQYVTENKGLPSQSDLTWPITLPTVGAVSDPASIVPPGQDVVTDPTKNPTTSQLVYYSSNPPSASTAIGTSPAYDAVSALLTVVATSLPNNALTRQMMQDLVTFGTNNTTWFDDAIFGGTGLSFSNSMTVEGLPSTIYSNDSTNPNELPCSNSIYISGTLVVPNYTPGSGTWDLNNQCQINGNFFTAWPIAFTTSDWYVSGVLGAASTVDIENSVNTKSDSLETSGETVTYPTGQSCPNVFTGGCSVDGALTDNIAGSVQTFPEVAWSGTAPAGWQVVDANSCSAALLDIQTYSNDPISGQQGWVVNVTGCSDLNFNGSSPAPNGTDLTLGNNLMIVTNGEMSFSNPNGGQVSGGYDLYYVVPYEYDGTQTSCPAGDITIQQAPTFSRSTTVLFYTPCDFSEQDNPFFIAGVVYAGGTATFSTPGTIETSYFSLPLGSATAPVASVNEVWQRQAG